MLLKKPYAFLIKHFKLIHVLLTILSVYIIYRTNLLLKFFNDYLDVQNSVVGQSLRDNLFNIYVFILPIIIIIISIILLWFMIKKKKPYKFYLFNVIAYLFLFIVILYSNSFIGKMEVKIIDILNVRVLRDIFIILLSIQGINTIFLLVRALGFDIKKFEFMSDLNNLELSEDDREEIEIEFNIDSNERKRKIRRKLRYLKYSYKENKLFVGVILLIIILFIIFLLYKRINIYTKVHNEGSIINSDYYSYKVNSSYLLNTSYSGMKITNNYLIVISMDVKMNSFQNKLLTGNFKLQIGNNKYNTINTYDKYLIDIGNVYNNQDLTNSYNNYLLVYEIPDSDINKSMILLYYQDNNNIKVKLKPIKFTYQELDYKLGDIININNDIILVNEYEIKESFIIDYDYCIKDTCYKSIQYLVPSLNTNYDKAILRINGLFNKGTNSNYNSFTNILSSVGTIQYSINGENKYSSMTRINDLKSNEKNIYYYEVNKEILNADSIKLNFNTRKCKYSYILK